MDAEFGPALEMKLHVRRASPADAPAIVQIAQSTRDAAGWLPETYARLEALGYLGWVVVAGGPVVGFLVGRVTAGEAEVLNIAVAPEHRRRGCATALVAEALREFQASGARKVLLEVRESNDSAISLYEKCGFRPCGRRPAYYQNPSEGGICMVLNSHSPSWP